MTEFKTIFQWFFNNQLVLSWIVFDCIKFKLFSNPIGVSNLSNSISSELKRILNGSPHTNYASMKICNLSRAMFFKLCWNGRFNLAWNELQICIFGTIANILNIIILTRKEMTKTPINAILKCKFMCNLINFCDPCTASLYSLVIVFPSSS